MSFVFSRRTFAFGALALGSLGALQNSFAQIFPAKPVRVIVPFTAGSAIDVNARVIGQKLGELWGQPVVIDNRVGANTIIGVEAIMKSVPDGYTIGLVNDAAMAVNPALYPKLPYDP
ncbi:MAG: tripartite tricarboxylate transporter substrate-binding protein, partial [Burkholderiales bacterium]